MRMNQRTLISILALTLLPLSAGAQPFGPGHRGMKGHRGLLPPGPVLTKIAMEVGLSDNQVARIKKISFDTERQCIGLRSKLEESRLDLRQAMDGDKPPSEQQVKNLVKKIGDYEIKLQQQQVLKVLRIRKTMSLQQWRKLEAVSAEHKWKKRGKRGKGRGFGPGGGMHRRGPGQK